MLLAVLDLIATGEAKPQHVDWSRGSREQFAAYFEIVRTPLDKNTPENPFYHLRSEGFWRPFRVDGSGQVTDLQAPPLAGDLDTEWRMERMWNAEVRMSKSSSES